MYEANFNGLLQSYIMGLPFFGYSLISTFIFAAAIETILKFKKIQFESISLKFFSVHKSSQLSY